MQWYYAIGRERKGPVGDDDIRRLVREGSLTSEALVWNSTMGSVWARVCDLPQLLSEPAPAEPDSSSVPAQDKTQPALRFAKKEPRPPARHTAPTATSARAAAALRVAKAGGQKMGIFGLACPHCGQKVRRSFNADVQKWAGLVGVLFAAAFGGFECDNCGTVARRDFAPPALLKMTITSLLFVLLAVVLIVFIIWLSVEYYPD